MSHMASKSPSSPDLKAPLEDEGSTIRSRDAVAESPRQERRSHSSTRPATPGSLDDRIEQKLRIAQALLQNLPSSDSRVRLLNIAIMRRDEALLDGVLSELNKPASRR
jgi:hypothetical protein